MEKQELDSNVKKTSVSTPKKLECPAMISGSAFGTFGQSRQFGADLPRSQTISITGGFATLASASASEGGFAAVATGSGGGGFDGVLSGGAPTLAGELGVSSLGDEFEETSEELEKKSGDELEEATKEVEIKKETKKGRKKMITVRKSEKKMLPKKVTEEPSAEVDLGKVTKKKKRATQNITPVKKPTKDGQPRKKLGKKSGIIVKIAKEYVPYSGQMVSMRTATSHFITMISRLNEDQRKVVEKIGKINVTALEVREIFGLPMGEKEVIEREKPRDRDEVVAEFKFQFPPESADRVLLVELTNFMKSQKDAGWMFTINFMVVFATIFGNTMKNSTVNKRFLNNIRQDADIKNYNWCEYLIKCLKRERRDWNGLNSFCGPLQFLAMLMVHDDFKRRKENIGILGVKYIKDSMLESIQTSLEAKIKLDEDDIEMKKKKKKNILNASRVLKEKPSQDTVESKTSNVRSEGDIESEKKKSNKRTVSKKESPRKKKMVDLDCTQNQITPTNECESQKNKRKNSDSDEGKKKKSKKGAYSENEISTSTKEISDDITPSLVMAFDKVDNELNSKKEKVKKAQSEIKPGKLTSSLSLSARKKFLKNLSLNDGADENKNMAKDSDEGKQKEISAQYDITPRMMLEFEKSEKTKDVRNEDISDDITPSLVMAFDKVDNEVNSKKDSKVVANEPVLSFGFSMIASPDKQDDFDKDLDSKKEKVESPHTETKQGENAEVSEKDDDFMMAKDSDEGKQKETSAQYDITPRMMLEFEKSEKTKDVRNEDISDDITPSLVMAFDKVDNEVNSKKDSKVVANEPVLSFGLSMIASPDKQDDFDKDLNSKKEKVESPHTETKQDSDEGKQKETTAKYDITPSLMLEFEKSEKPKDVRNEEISDDITPSLVMAFDKVDNELNSKKESKVIANEPAVSFGFSMISSPEKQMANYSNSNTELAKIGVEGFALLDGFYGAANRSNPKYPPWTVSGPPPNQTPNLFHYNHHPQQPYVVRQQMYVTQVQAARVETVVDCYEAAKRYGGTVVVEYYPKRKTRRKGFFYR
ncbi:hypothetical protein SSX86_001594 [Deinandra increscens subsp. villosa]|uniref:Uncharacterized protein n=1 Tax=Deinandra increscens subsp. villosa TaxID=3103831 RepID=A0AAP0HAY7_9ASTR